MRNYKIRPEDIEFLAQITGGYPAGTPQSVYMQQPQQQAAAAPVQPVRNPTPMTPAASGLVMEDQMASPYDREIEAMRASQQPKWARILSGLGATLQDAGAGFSGRPSPGAVSALTENRRTQEEQLRDLMLQRDQAGQFGRAIGSYQGEDILGFLKSNPDALSSVLANPEVFQMLQPPIPERAILGEGEVWQDEFGEVLGRGPDKVEAPPTGMRVDENGNWLWDPNWYQGSIDLAHARSNNVTQTVSSTGSNAVDSGMATLYNDFVTSGGYADADKNISQIQYAIDALDSGANLTGGITGLTPDFIRVFTNPQSLDVRAAVEEVAQRNLRAVLGGQFSENEGKQLIARAYDDRLDEATNVRRLKRLLSAIQSAYEAKLQAVNYFEQNGFSMISRDGQPYRGAYNISLRDIERMAGLDQDPMSIQYPGAQ
jgi:hypothetical protein